jgi:fructoselysine-6-P-deglycase FrlB-like protein
METALTRLTTLSSEEKDKKGILYTPGEIYNQVELWSDTFRRFKGRREELADFLTRFKKDSRLSFICTGAGTSEFVGYCIEALMRKKLGVPVNVISTPKIVTTPQDFFIEGYATLLLSFARSGNSPESLGAVKIADMLCKNVYHLVITCNEQGALFREINGGNYGTAVESHLKLQELTAGQIMCTWDTFPGLRHGPEAVVDPNTLVVAYLAADGYTQRYELDLLREIREKGIGKAVLSVAHAVPDEIKELSDYTIEYGPKADPVPDDLIPPVYIIVGQLLGLFTSLRLGLCPDNPSASGIIHRVVEGVKVYDPQVYSRTGRNHVLAER